MAAIRARHDTVRVMRLVLPTALLVLLVAFTATRLGAQTRKWAGCYGLKVGPWSRPMAADFLSYAPPPRVHLDTLAIEVPGRTPAGAGDGLEHSAPGDRVPEGKWRRASRRSRWATQELGPPANPGAAQTAPARNVSWGGVDPAEPKEGDPTRGMHSDADLDGLLRLGL